MSYRPNANGPKNYVKKPKNERPRNARLTFKILCTGVNKNGFEYDPENCFAILEDLQKNNVYDNINIPVQIGRSLLDNEPKKGQSTVAHVLEYDPANQEMSIMVYGNFVERIDKIPDLVIEPRVMVRDGIVTCILSLDIVQFVEDMSDDGNEKDDNVPTDAADEDYDPADKSVD